MKQYHIKPLFDLRWRLEYNDGTAVKYGQWTRPDDNLKNMVSFQKTENLSRAVVEARNKTTGEVMTPVHCAGYDFVMFKWEFICSIGTGLNLQPNKDYTPPVQVTGLMIITREFEAIVRVDGSSPIIRARSEEEKKINYKCYGK